MNDPKGIVVKYTADKMKAYVSLSQGLGPVTAGVVLTELLRKGVVHGLNTAIIHKFVGASLFDKFVEVAAGTGAVPGADGRIEVLVPGFTAPDAGGKVPDSKALCRFLAVKAGGALARRVPPTQGTNGMDVFGTPIAAPPVKDADLTGGPGAITMSGDPDTLVAEYDGVFERLPDGVMRVSPYMEVGGDVTGDIVFDGCLRVMGSVHAGFSVDVTGSILVDGDVADAKVKCGGDLAVGGARGTDGLTIDCGGSMRAARIDGAKMTVGGCLTVAEGISNSEITVGGCVKACTIVGGSITAAGGVTAAQIGVEGGTAQTVLDVGVVYRYAKDMEGAMRSIGTQTLMTEGYISQLYCFVRDNMDDDGLIMHEKAGAYELFLKNLTESITASRKFEADVERFRGMLRDAEGCSITAMEIYPNVLLKLGISEQRVLTLLKNVSLKPAGVDV